MGIIDSIIEFRKFRKAQKEKEEKEKEIRAVHELMTSNDDNVYHWDIIHFRLTNVNRSLIYSYTVEEEADVHIDIRYKTFDCFMPSILNNSRNYQFISVSYNNGVRPYSYNSGIIDLPIYAASLSPAIDRYLEIKVKSLNIQKTSIYRIDLILPIGFFRLSDLG